MIPVDIEDVVNGFAAAQNLYKTGFRNASSLNPSYNELGEEIRKLAINLDLLSNVWQRAHYQTGLPGKGAQHASASRETQILGSFQGSISACEKLLGDGRYFQRSGGFVNNLCWYPQIEPEVQKLKESIACHNIKLSIIFSILDPQVLEDRSFYIIDSTAVVLACAEQLGRSVHGENIIELPSSWGTGNLAIPRELEDGFIRTTRQLNPNYFSVDGGIEGAVMHFNKITKSSSEVVSSDVTYHVAVIDLMMATWLAKTVRGSRDYEFIARYPSNTAFARQIDYWGMTIERFFDHFENILQDALRRLLGRYMVLPPTPDLLAIFESQQSTGQRSQQHTPQLHQVTQAQGSQNGASEMEDTSTPSWQVERDQQHGVKEMGAFLRSSDPEYTQTMQVYKHTELRSSLVLVKTPLGEGREKETRDNYELNKVQIVPSYALRTWTAPPAEPQTMVFRTDHESPFFRTLVFHQNKDMFGFQQRVTGYRVVHDVPRVLTTSQESKLLGGSSRQDLCRVQLWSPPPPKDESILQSAASSSSASSPPTKSKRMSQTSSSSSSSMGQKSKRKSTPSIFSVTSRLSSSSRRTSVIKDEPSYTTTSVGGSMDHIFVAPTPPCVVLFAHKAPKLSERVEGKDISRSFLIVDIGPDVTTEEELSERDEGTNSPASYCCVIECKSSYLQARRSPETSDPALWDIATAGLYQREKETEVVKKMKHVILQFETKQDLVQFMTKFEQVKAVANMRLARFIKATGGGSKR